MHRYYTTMGLCTTGRQTPYLPLVGWYKQVFFVGPNFTGPNYFRPKLFPALIIAAFDQIGRIRAGKKRADKVDIVEDNSLKLLMSYGTKFREPVYLTASELSNSLLVDINTFIHSKSRKYRSESGSAPAQKKLLQR